MGLRGTFRRAMRLVPAMLALGAGCELLVDGKVETIHCSAEGSIGLPACPEGYFCKEGSCVGLIGLGKACAQDDDCATGDFCLDSPDFGEDKGKFCARGCCSSSDCDPETGFVCWMPEGSAFGFCRSAASAGRPATGALMAGETCNGDGECRSGKCSSGACTDTCCSDANCGGQTCQLTSGLISERPSWACQSIQSSKKDYLELCATDDECTSGVCVQIGIEGRCSIPCCGSEDCPGVVEPQSGGVYAVRCKVISHNGASLRACADLTEPDAIGSVGAPCTSDDECRGGLCLLAEGGGEGACSDLCCMDQACGDPSAFGCRPSKEQDGSWALRCEPK